MRRNPYLAEELEAVGHNDEETWRSIMIKGGSVQHLDFLDDHTKAVFRTFGEIAQPAVCIQAAQRQQFIDQGQSLNLMIHPDVPLKDVNQLMIDAWKGGLKSLYYQRSTNPAQELVRALYDCHACEA